MTARALPPVWLLVLLQGAVSAASLVVEIVAGRMLAPYVGMSLYTWTSVIAVVLAGFSVGHWIGGIIAERAPGRALLATGWALAAAALTTAGAVFLLRWGAALVLPATIGAIAGTLLAGFLFIAWLGSIGTLAAVTLAYALATLILFGLGRRAGEVPALALMTGALIAPLALAATALAAPSPCSVESRYFCLRSLDVSSDPQAPQRLMVLDHLAHGISARDAPEVMHTDHAALLEVIARLRMGAQPFGAFFIGGGTYSIPRAWDARAPRPEMTVAEIDPAVTEMAIADFWFDPDGVEILHEDARRALAGRADRYDVIIGDAFTDIAVPQHLITREFFELAASRLAPGGVYLMNVIDHAGSLAALAAILATAESARPRGSAVCPRTFWPPCAPSTAK